MFLYHPVNVPVYVRLGRVGFPPSAPLFGALSQIGCPWIFTWIYKFVSCRVLRPEVFLLILLSSAWFWAFALACSPLPSLDARVLSWVVAFRRGGGSGRLCGGGSRLYVFGSITLSWFLFVCVLVYLHVFACYSVCVYMFLQYMRARTHMLCLYIFLFMYAGSYT